MLFVCLFVWLFVCLFVWLFVCLFVGKTIVFLKWMKSLYSIRYGYEAITDLLTAVTGVLVTVDITSVQCMCSGNIIKLLFDWLAWKFTLFCVIWQWLCLWHSLQITQGSQYTYIDICCLFVCLWEYNCYTKMHEKLIFNSIEVWGYETILCSHDLCLSLPFQILKHACISVTWLWLIMTQLILYYSLADYNTG